MENGLRAPPRLMMPANERRSRLLLKTTEQFRNSENYAETECSPERAIFRWKNNFSSWTMVHVMITRRLNYLLMAITLAQTGSFGRNTLELKKSEATLALCVHLKATQLSCAYVDYRPLRPSPLLTPSSLQPQDTVSAREHLQRKSGRRHNKVGFFRPQKCYC